MVLSDSVIMKEMEAGNIILSPFKKENLGPNSYDMTLAPTCKIYSPYAVDKYPPGFLEGDRENSKRWINFECEQGYLLDCRKNNPVYEFDIPESGFVLQPGHLYLYSCVETLGVKNNVCATVMGKSSLGRLGLDIHVCAGFVDTGFEGSLVLEMRTIYPLRIYPGMKICQVKFERVEGIVEESYDQKAGSKYHLQEGVVASQYHKNYDNGSNQV